MTGLVRRLSNTGQRLWRTHKRRLPAALACAWRMADVACNAVLFYHLRQLQATQTMGAACRLKNYLFEGRAAREQRLALTFYFVADFCVQAVTLVKERVSYKTHASAAAAKAAACSAQESVNRSSYSSQSSSSQSSQSSSSSWSSSYSSSLSSSSLTARSALAVVLLIALATDALLVNEAYVLQWERSLEGAEHLSGSVPRRIGLFFHNMFDKSVFLVMLLYRLFRMYCAGKALHASVKRFRQSAHYAPSPVSDVHVHVHDTHKDVSHARGRAVASVSVTVVPQPVATASTGGAHKTCAKQTVMGKVTLVQRTGGGGGGSSSSNSSDATTMAYVATRHTPALQHAEHNHNHNQTQDQQQPVTYTNINITLDNQEDGDLFSASSIGKAGAGVTRIKYRVSKKAKKKRVPLAHQVQQDGEATPSCSGSEPVTACAVTSKPPRGEGRAANPAHTGNGTQRDDDDQCHETVDANSNNNNLLVTVVERHATGERDNNDDDDDNNTETNKQLTGKLLADSNLNDDCDVKHTHESVSTEEPVPAPAEEVPRTGRFACAQHTSAAGAANAPPSTSSATASTSSSSNGTGVLLFHHHHSPPPVKKQRSLSAPKSTPTADSDLSTKYACAESLAHLHSEAWQSHNCALSHDASVTNHEEAPLAEEHGSGSAHGSGHCGTGGIASSTTTSSSSSSACAGAYEDDGSACTHQRLHAAVRTQPAALQTPPAAPHSAAKSAADARCGRFLRDAFFTPYRYGASAHQEWAHTTRGDSNTRSGDVPPNDESQYAVRVDMDAPGGQFCVLVHDVLNFDAEFDRQCIDKGLDYYPIVLAKLRIIGELRDNARDDAGLYAHFTQKINTYLNIYSILKKNYE